jgi:four helix bundle protein
MEAVKSRPAQTFRDLRVWQEARKLASGIYKVSSSFPKHEQYALTSQMTRAAVSVCSNIAEGFGRRSVKEKSQFYSMANGSLTELECQLTIANDIGYISEPILRRFDKQCDKVHKQLVGLQKANSNRQQVTSKFDLRRRLKGVDHGKDF